MAFPATSTRALTSVLNQQTTASFNSAIRSSVDQALYKQALLLYLQLKRSGLRPDNLTFPFVLKASSKLPDPKLSQMIHTHVAKSRFYYDPFVATAMINLYVKCRELTNAEKIFDEMPERDVTAWNSLILGFSEMGFLNKVLVLLRWMRLEKIRPDSLTVISLVQGLDCDKEVGFLRSCHCLGMRIGVSGDVSVCNTWISAYAKCGDLGSAKLMFGEIPDGLRSIVSWNSVISGCTYLGKIDEVGDLLRGMSRDGVRPDLSTVLSLLSLFGQSESIIEGITPNRIQLQTKPNKLASVSNQKKKMNSSL
ncbi:uncharacterized protein A4U43_C03F17310 [Asparagus officinalis]|uniref:Pentacotripeptide-repeat region of PRORP domain-containing protein n=1 Tax=Asparagus officinalis TaxID=4686 RepID=A0A5P1FFS6_ASPOF|nr:uncharacterized protein A4U43_C03F17310 [Asparagus officinalis]